MAASLLASRLSALYISSASPLSSDYSSHIVPRGSTSTVSSSHRVQLFRKSLYGTPLASGAPSSGAGGRRNHMLTSAAFQEVPEGEEVEEEESPEELAAAYEKIYGKPFSGLKQEVARSSGGDDEEEEEEPGRRRGGRGRDSDRGGRGGDRRQKEDPEFEERVVQVRRVTKVVKGGKQMAFRAVVIIGDKKGRVGVGVGKAKEVTVAVQKSVVDAKRHMITVPMTKYLTFPHRANGRFGAATVMLRPAAPGTGVIAGGSVRVVLELAGVENALGKELGSGNPLNNARAVLEACVHMKQFRDVAAKRGIPMEELWK